MAFRFKKIVLGSGFFTSVRSLVSNLGLRGSNAPLKVIRPPLTYTKSWDASPYLEKLAVKYLLKRPEYNAGWKTIVDNMIENIKGGGYISCQITKTHTWDPENGVGSSHSTFYNVDLFHNLEGATNHPDLMDNYISELEDIFNDYRQSYIDSEVNNVSSEEEWAVRLLALEKYSQDVEELLSEVD